jgi:hypothetical protein
LILFEELTIRRFLLGVANEAEVCRVEEGILTGEFDSHLLQDAEDELIDDACLERLTPSERLGYATNFLITEDRKRRHAFGLVLIDYVKEQPVVDTQSVQQVAESRRQVSLLSWKRTACFAMAASVLLAVLGTFEYMALIRAKQLAVELQSQLAQLRASLAQGADGISLAKEHSQVSSSDELAQLAQMPVIDFSSSTRDIHPILLRIPAQAKFVEMEVTLVRPLSASYRELVLRQDGKQMWVQEFPSSFVSATGKCASAVPASALPPGVYHFKFEEGSSEGRFQELIDQVFRVER